MAGKSKSHGKAPQAKAAPKLKTQAALPAKKAPAARKPSPAKAAAPTQSESAHKKNSPATAKDSVKKTAPVKVSAEKPVKAPKPASPAFLAKQRERLLALKDTLLDSMRGVARDSLRSRAEGSEASAFGMHQADAGSDAYDRDFALSLLSQEQDSLYEIDEALKRIDQGTYGICEMSGKAIPHQRLEALPFTRYTVECQAELEKRNRFQRVRQPVTSLFGLNDEDSEDSEDDSSDNKD
ncbi:MAG: hypothetical protein Fur0032_15120 [Terrimicrobiaceae bacterium]